MKSSLRIIMLSLVSAALLGVLFYSVYSILKAEAETRQLLLRAEALSGNDSWTKSVKSLHTGSNAEIEVISEAAITRTELISLIESLESAARGLGLKVSVSSIKSEAGQSSTTPETVKMVVDTEGSWPGNFTFIKLLQSLPVKSEIESSSLSHTGKVWRSGTTLKVIVFPEI